MHPRSIHHRLAWASAALLFGCAAQAATPAAAAPAAAQASEQAARARADEDRENSGEAAADAARELQETQAELARLAARVAELARRQHREDMEQALRLTSPLRPVLGVVLQADPEAGVRVAAVSPDSAAESAGLVAGDRIVEIDGQPLRDGDPARRLAAARGQLAKLSPEREVKLVVESDGKRRNVGALPRSLPGLAIAPEAALDEAAMAARLGSLVAPRWAFRIEDHLPQALCGDGSSACLDEALGAALGWRGVRMIALNPKLGRYFGSERGVLVLSNEAGVDGLEPGDVLLSIDGTAVEQPAEAMRLLRARAGQPSHAVRLLRDHKRRTLDLAAPKFAELPLLLPLAPPPPPAPPAAPAPAAAPASAPAPIGPVPPTPPAAPAPPAAMAPAVAPAASITLVRSVQHATAASAWSGPTPRPAPAPAPAPSPRGVLQQVLD